MKFTINLKSSLVLSLIFFIANSLFAQEIIEDKPVEPSTLELIDPSQARKIDGVAAVVGDYIVLDSDVDKTIAQIKASGADPSRFTRCELFGKLLEDKLYAHHAIQDSIVVPDAEIRSYVDQQIQQFKQQFKGSLDEVLKFYKKDDEQSLREEMYEINKANKLAAEMQKKIVDEVEVTPEEVRQFFNKIPKEERPVFGTELKVAQVVIEPKVDKSEEQRVIALLKEFKTDIEENGASFRAKAVFYTDDTASKKTGGSYTLNRARPQMVKEFREIAFSLQEGEISEPFKTDFGYHIVQLDKIRGQEYDVRHILLIPKVSEVSVKEAREEIEKVKKAIETGDLTFAEAAKEFSDEVKTKNQGGQLINPSTQDYNFELTKMDPELYGQIQDISNDQVSRIITDQGRTGNLKFKILTVTDRIDEHDADYARDYLKIKELALNEKRLNTIGEWQERKILETYIKISETSKRCEFKSNWLKNKSN